MGLMQRIFGRGAADVPPPTYTNQAVIDRIVREEGVDHRAWHAFLLQRRDYEAYCKERSRTPNPGAGAADLGGGGDCGGSSCGGGGG